MSNTSPADTPQPTRRTLIALAAMSGMGPVLGQPKERQNTPQESASMTASFPSPLPARQLAIGPIAASMATGDMPALDAALNHGLDTGLSIADIKEVLVQLYAYTGFPRSLNALSALMKVTDDRRARGLEDAAGTQPGPVPTGQALLELGTANQTRLSGAPVKGPLFDFAPAVDQFLKTHLFGDIFARDNLDWQSRELATVAALGALSGVEPQLLSHIRISMNVGLTAGQMAQFGESLQRSGFAQAGRQIRTALQKFVSDTAKR